MVLQTVAPQMKLIHLRTPATAKIYVDWKYSDIPAYFLDLLFKIDSFLFTEMSFPQAGSIFPISFLFPPYPTPFSFSNIQC